MVNIKNFSKPLWVRQQPSGSNNQERFPLTEKSQEQLNSNVNPNIGNSFLKILRRPFIKQVSPECGSTTKRHTAKKERLSGSEVSQVNSCNYLNFHPRPPLEETCTQCLCRFLVHQRYRTVRFDVPQEVSLNTIIAGMAGGPLQRIKEIANPSSDTGHRIVDVTYLNACDAKLFYDYANAGRFVIACHSLRPVNGLVVLPWADREHYHSWRDRTVQNCTPPDTPYRCLNLLHLCDPKALRRIQPVDSYTKKRCNQIAVMSETWYDIKSAFALFGKVVDISSHTTSKISFIIHYADLSSAIAAKRNFDSKVSSIISLSTILLLH